MFLHEKHKLQLQIKTLPEGFVLVTSGKIRQGDIRWNVYDDSWNVSDVTRSPKHDIIIGDPVSNFGGVCRPVSEVEQTGPEQQEINPLNIPQFIELNVRL